MIEEAFQHVKRADFLPRRYKMVAGLDQPLPIGHGQTNSQPSTVAFMLKKLDVQPAHNVLDVGSGSGWTTALLAYLVGKRGCVTGVEIVPALAREGQHNLGRYELPWAGIHQAAESQLGWPESAPYDRILVSAAATEFPNELTDQLKENGRMIAPVGSELVLAITKHKGELELERFPGFAFVPLK